MPVLSLFTVFNYGLIVVQVSGVCQAVFNTNVLTILLSGISSNTNLTATDDRHSKKTLAVSSKKQYNDLNSLLLHPAALEFQKINGKSPHLQFFYT